MRSLYLLIALTFIGCTNDNHEEFTETSQKDILQTSTEDHNETIAIKPFNLIADSFIYTEFGKVLKSKNLFKFQSFNNLSKVKEVLISALPASELKDWIIKYKENLENDEWLTIKPICQAKKDSTLLFFLTTIEQVSAEGESYADYWCLKSEDGKTISKVTHLGISGTYPRIENGEEEGAEYWIKAVEEEALEIVLNAPDSIVTRTTKYTLTEGYDWRVDQNLKINDSVAMPEVIHIIDAL